VDNPPQLTQDNGRTKVLLHWAPPKTVGIKLGFAITLSSGQFKLINGIFIQHSLQHLPSPQDAGHLSKL